jgi:glycosyltransferase involved in cell wall biosynthesis
MPSISPMSPPWPRGSSRSDGDDEPAALMPRVTVIMATYNWSTVLPYSIASVLDQTFTDFELLVIGDGCTDDSGEVVAAISDSRVEWYDLASHTGHQSAPNNEGIRRAGGEVIAYLGHDDLWLPRHLEVLLGALDGGARIAHATTLGVVPDRRPAPWPAEEWAYTPGAYFPPTTAVHDRALIESVGGWRPPCDTGLDEPEAELWGSMAEAGHPPRWVRRLTSVKLAAGDRRDVYRTRPHHEQAYWLRRIRRAEDPETSLLAAYDGRYLSAVERCHQIRRHLTSALAARLRLRTRLRHMGLLPPLPPDAQAFTAEERWRARRRFKGIDD